MGSERAIIKLEEYEQLVRTNVNAVTAHFEAHGHRIGTTLTLHFGFADDGKAIAVEPTTGAYMILGDFPP